MDSLRNPTTPNCFVDRKSRCIKHLCQLSEKRFDLCAWKHTNWLTGQKKSSFFVCLLWPSVDLTPCVSFSLCSVLSVQSRCTETAQTNRCSTAAPAGRRSTGSLSTGTGRRRLIPKTTHVSTVSCVVKKPQKPVFIFYMIGLPSPGLRANSSTHFHSHLEHFLLLLWSS